MSQSNNINDIIDKIEEKQLRLLYHEFEKVINIISKFIIKKKLILYGGLVINLCLPQKYKFYKKYTINDYDCYSKDPYSDSLELAKLIKKQNYKFIKIKYAKHDGTLKIYVYGKQIFDVTFIEPEIYDKIIKYTNKKENKLKYYKDKYKIIPLEYMKLNLYFELARPEQSGWRWEKIYNRLNILNKVYPTKESDIVVKKCLCLNVNYNNMVNIVLEYIKTNKCPIIDSYPLRLYTIKNKNCCFRLSEKSRYITILSNEYIKSKQDIINILNNYVDKSNYKILSKLYRIDNINLYNYYDISIVNLSNNDTFNIIKIIQCKNECFSINNKNGFITGSLDTNIYFLYLEYIKNKIFLDNDAGAAENLYYINKYEEYIKNDIKNDIKKRLRSECYGIINKEDDIKKLWKKRLTLKYV